MGCRPRGVAIEITPDIEQPLNDEKRAICRSACMRLSYLALDRADLQFVSKECARGMANPQERNWQMLKHAACNTVAAPRLIREWKRQHWPS